MTARRLHRRRSRLAAVERALTGLLAMLVVLGGVLDLHHQATTRHLRCAEHGALVHSSAGALDLAGTGDPVGIALRATANEFHQVPRSGEHREHEHCAFPCAATASTVESPRLHPVKTDAAPPAVVAIVDVAVTPGRGVYRSAPKTSPPA